jgi:plastocyanin
MRRAAAAAACLALIAALALVPAAGGAASTPACAVWKKHHKRVVKHVKRDGDWKRVVRIKRWRTCAKRVATPAPAPPVVPAPEPQPTPEDPSIPRLGVKAVEWGYTLSRPEVPAGEVIVELNNMGEDPHNLNLQLDDESGPEQWVPVTGPAGQSKAKFDLPAGTYRLWCSLDGHEVAGMKATLIVAP